MRLMEQKTRERLAEEIPVFFERKLRSLSEATDTRVQTVLRPYQERADRFVESIRRTAAELFDVPYRAPDSTHALEMTHKPYWVTYNWSTLISPVPEGLIDRLLPVGARRRRIQRRLADDTDTLSVRNVENVRWATLRNLDDAFRRFGSELDEQFKNTIEATRGAIQSGRLRRKENLETVDSELQRLWAKESELAEIEESLVPFAASREKHD